MRLPWQPTAHTRSIAAPRPRVPGACQRTVAHSGEREWMGIEPTWGDKNRIADSDNGVTKRYF